MNLLRFDIQESKVIPFVAISLLLTHMTVSFFDLEMFLASYVALAGMIVAFLGSIVLLIRQKTLHLFDVNVLFFLLLIEGISFLYGNDWKNWLYISFSISTYLFLFNFYHEKYRILILGILFVLSAAIYCQLFQCITHPEMWIIDERKELRGFLLGGNYNQMGSRLIIALTAGVLSVKYNKWFWLNLIPLFISSFAILFMVRSMNSLSCLFLFLIFILIRNERLLSLGTMGLYIAVFFFQVFVCFSGKGLENNELASWFIEDLLGKDMTFTGRTEMWDSALRAISDSPIWGFGYVDADWYKAHMTNLAIGAHNFILNTMIYGGVISIILYFLIIMRSILNLIRNNDIHSKRMIAAFGIISTMMLFETYNLAQVFLLLTIMYYYPGKNLNIETTPDVGNNNQPIASQT